ncbi:hypothetical protein J7T55_001218 [Diaporthe amygdali]|uniref:uncharacterized protein n=1 Tax=Phomopsis amygdali TaxID=1214568 RepID=UPI0022FEFF9D|nr:uncharacterized protein J7T55_001218 [Diaporthe amygdali]KAJ0103762.1 hypothetical protein J7T55_001218 [Diaporthe amygdali]
MEQAIRKQVRDSENGDMVTELELQSLLPKLASMGENHIFKLPDEVLIKVFEDVRGDLHVLQDGNPIGINDIKNLRLTCRRFCDASSHLLLHRQDVSLTTPSLEHFDEVSRHPTISKGIRAIRLTLYHPVTTKSLRDFLYEFVGILDHQDEMDCSSIKNSLDWIKRHKSAGFGGILRADLSQLYNNLNKRSKVVLSCTKFLRDEELQADEVRIMETLCQLYSQLTNEQEALLKDGNFATRVAEARARMPNATELLITECIAFDQVNGFFRKRGLPQCWATDSVPLPKQALELLYELPLAIARSGNSLAQLRIRLDPHIEHKLRLSKQETRDLLNAAGDLRLLEIDCQMGMKGFRTKKEPSKKLVQHIERLSPGTYIFLNEVCLLSGVWADLLDALCGKADCNSVVRPNITQSSTVSFVPDSIGSR